jgi:hypothetical protein
MAGVHRPGGTASAADVRVISAARCAFECQEDKNTAPAAAMVNGKMNKTHGDDWISRAILEEKGSTRLIGRRRPGT